MRQQNLQKENNFKSHKYTYIYGTIKSRSCYGGQDHVFYKGAMSFDSGTIDFNSMARRLVVVPYMS